MKEIVINRMYAGSYLANNLGHEVINMFQADNGKHYLYLNPRGNILRNNVDCMLLVRYVGDDRVEILALAKNLKQAAGASSSLPRDLGEKKESVSDIQEKYIHNEDIRYGDAPILEIFNDAEQQNIFITYEVTEEDFFVPIKRMYISFDPANRLKSDIPINNLNFGSSTLRQYVLPTVQKKNADNEEMPEYKDSAKDGQEDSDYKTIKDIIDDSSLWRRSNEQVGTLALNCCSPFIENPKMFFGGIHGREANFYDSVYEQMRREFYVRIWSCRMRKMINCMPYPSAIWPCGFYYK